MRLLVIEYWTYKEDDGGCDWSLGMRLDKQSLAVVTGVQAALSLHTGSLELLIAVNLAQELLSVFLLPLPRNCAHC